MQKNNVTERQHYIPKGYLRLFSVQENNKESEMVWVYDKRSKKIKARLVSVKSIAFQSFYYAENRDNLDRIEKVLAQLEDKAIKIIRNIEAYGNNQIEFDDENRNILAFFIALSLTRVPAFRNGINKVHERIASKALNILCKKKLIDQNFIDQNKVQIKVNNCASLSAMVRVAELIFNTILGKYWQFFIPSAKQFFITSDNPVALDNSVFPYAGPAHPYTELIMALRKDLLIVITPRNPEKLKQNNLIFQADYNEVWKFNQAIIKAAERFVISDRQSELVTSLVARHPNCEQKIEVFP